MKLEGGEADIEWTSILANAQAMGQRHQGQLAEELKTEPSSDIQQLQQQPTSQSNQQATASVDGGIAGDSQAADPGSMQQQQQSQQQAGGGDESVAATQQEISASQKPEDAWLSDMVSGCVSMLLTMQKCAQQPAAGLSVNTALASSLRMLQPHAASNQPIFKKIEQTVMLLRNQLLQGSTN